MLSTHPFFTLNIVISPSPVTHQFRSLLLPSQHLQLSISTSNLLSSPSQHVQGYNRNLPFYPARYLPGWTLLFRWETQLEPGSKRYSFGVELAIDIYGVFAAGEGHSTLVRNGKRASVDDRQGDCREHLGERDQCCVVCGYCALTGEMTSASKGGSSTHPEAVLEEYEGREEEQGAQGERLRQPI